MLEPTQGGKKSRAGTTLMEVLVSIFVMGIGLLAILTLFPLGASYMAQAIRDDRVAHCSANAQALAIAQDLRHDPNVVAAFDNPTGALPNGTAALRNLATLTLNINGTTVPYDGPSYPVFLDPLGWSMSNSQWVGDQAQAGQVARVTTAAFLKTPPPNLQLLNSFALLDEIDFAPNGAPDQSSGAAVNRQVGFSWALMMRRPRRGDPSIVQCYVVVYSQRPLALGASFNPRENTYTNVTFNTNNNTITVTWIAGQQQAVQVRPGDWILDSSIITTDNKIATKRPHGFFYRINEVNELGPNQVELAIEGSLKDFPATATGIQPAVIILEGVTEVIDKGTSWLP